jgi:DNA-3-methyladenine glycosylase II
MVLCRADAWPVGDVALAQAIMEVKKLPARPGHDEVARIGEQWRPWRAAAARILWHHYLSVRKK